MARLNSRLHTRFDRLPQRIEAIIAAPHEEARRLAIVSLTALVLLIIATVVRLFLIDSPIKVPGDLIATFALMSTMYALSRTRYYRLGVLLGIIGTWIISLNIVLTYQSSDAMVILVAPLLIVTLFFGARSIFINTVALVATLSLIYYNAPGDWDYAGPVIFFFILTGGVLMLQSRLNERANQANRAFLSDMHALQSIIMDLSRIEDIDTLCRQMIELPRSRLSFDRIALFLLDCEAKTLYGTYGVDRDGQLRDERYYHETIPADHWSYEVMTAPNRAFIRHQAPLRDNGQTVGTGWHASTTLWNGERAVGFLVADCLTQKRPPRPYEIELLSLLGNQFGHILQRQQIEEKLRQQERLLSGILSSVPSFIYIYDFEQDRNIFANEGLTRILGYTPAELQALGSNVVPQMVHPDDIDTVLSGINHAKDATGKDFRWHNTYRLKHKDGSWRWIQDQGIIYGRDANGTVTQILGAVIDIHDLRQTEEALRQSESKFRTLAENSIDLIQRIDREGRHLYVNPTFADYVGLPTEQIIGKSNEEIGVPPDFLAYFTTLREQVYTSSEMVEMDFTYMVNGKERQLNVRLVPEFGPDGEVETLLALGRDMTERVEAQQRAFTAALEHERMRLLAAFITNATHEFRNPLTIISTSAYLISRLDDPEGRADKVTKIQDQVNRITRLVDSLLLTARLETVENPQRDPVDLAAICNAACQGLEYLYPDRPPIKTHGLDDLPPVPGNADDLQAAITHVLENACRFTPPDAPIRLEAGVEGDRVWLAVRDSGTGIAPDDLPHIFELFWRADQAHTTPGFGLGLSIARKIARLHGGDITVETAAGVGSTFRLILPVYAEYS